MKFLMYITKSNHHFNIGNIYGEKKKANWKQDATWRNPYHKQYRKLNIQFLGG